MYYARISGKNMTKLREEFPPIQALLLTEEIKQFVYPINRFNTRSKNDDLYIPISYRQLEDDDNCRLEFIDDIIEEINGCNLVEKLICLSKCEEKYENDIRDIIEKCKQKVDAANYEKLTAYSNMVLEIEKKTEDKKKCEKLIDNHWTSTAAAVMDFENEVMRKLQSYSGEERIKKLEDHFEYAKGKIQEKLDQMKLCIICQDRQRNCKPSGCSHFQFCKQCLNIILQGNKQCPTCRREFHRVFKVTW